MLVIWRGSCGNPVYVRMRASMASSSISSSSTSSPSAFRVSKIHAFAGNPLVATVPNSNASSSSGSNSNSENVISVDSVLAAIRNLLRDKHSASASALEGIDARILPVSRGKPLVTSTQAALDAAPVWRLAWQSAEAYKGFLLHKHRSRHQQEQEQEQALVFLGYDDGIPHFAADFSNVDSDDFGAGDDGAGAGVKRSSGSAFVELRTLMVAADWSDPAVLAELSIAGHARAVLEWHSLSQFCSFCSTKLVPVEAGRRRQCQNNQCKRRFYPRVDPVVIMLVIDRANDRALLSRQSRFVPRMWSCLAGFIEPGESLEEAVRRETLEEVGIEVGEVIYHSSQPWPVGPRSMPCQLMVGFFAFAKTFDIRVDKNELEDAQWHSREDVKKALSCAEYKKAQKTSAFRVHQVCGGVEKGQGLASDFNVETGELAPMFVPGPFAIAHHLISSWAHMGADALIR